MLRTQFLFGCQKPRIQHNDIIFNPKYKKKTLFSDILVSLAISQIFSRQSVNSKFSSLLIISSVGTARGFLDFDST